MRHYHDFTRPDGTVVSVRFRLSAGSGPTYHPAYGADGGDAAECEIDEAIIDGQVVELPTEELERFEEWLIANVDPWDYYDPPEPD